MQKVRWGVLSTANIAREAFIPAALASKYADIIAIGSGNDIVEIIARNFSIPTIYPSYDELLDCDEIDAVYIPLPNSMHEQWVKKAAAKGKHVLCEKPAGLSEKSLEEMVSVCLKNNVLFMEAFMYQFHPQHERVKEIIRLGVIGEVQQIEATFSFELNQHSPNIRLDKSLGGGSLFDVGCYCIHTFSLLLESLPKEVSAWANLKEVDLTANGRLVYDNGVQALFECSFEKPFKHEYTIIGTEGKITVPRAYRPDVTQGEGIIRIDKVGNNPKTESILADPYVNQIDYFSKAILDGRLDEELVQTSFQTIKIIETCYKSIETGTTIKLR
ncbi:Gfo/Idh/MocA family oxidoreductase [Bacillus luteolus]|uniref:Gfo/Idh/MocA family oxidoreductase n=1 Tax=Litchfieldia luteola TaxID=682179 RepID=A0ABR9QH98_9BACI|nr:Gfo/Idh/MocA family oxidoreductase [Cytobacillus luteolus]MBE4907851.1 Gfo/Idh/MocA family oxidoreductase [Cytobacillus luteolus]MBP1943991.1 putative dehydrogenase [Cytobacillus luteolus]